MNNNFINCFYIKTNILLNYSSNSFEIQYINWPDLSWDCIILRTPQSDDFLDDYKNSKSSEDLIFFYSIVVRFQDLSKRGNNVNYFEVHKSSFSMISYIFYFLKLNIFFYMHSSLKLEFSTCYFEVRESASQVSTRLTQYDKRYKIIIFCNINIESINCLRLFQQYRMTIQILSWEKKFVCWKKRNKKYN